MDERVDSAGNPVMFDRSAPSYKVDYSGGARKMDIGDSGFGMNLGTANTAVNIFSSALNFWSAREQNKINKETLQFNKDSFNKKFAVSMEDRARKIQNEENIANQYNRINGQKADSVSTQLDRTRGTVNSEGQLVRPKDKKQASQPKSN